MALKTRDGHSDRLGAVLCLSATGGDEGGTASSAGAGGRTLPDAVGQQNVDLGDAINPTVL